MSNHCIFEHEQQQDPKAMLDLTVKDMRQFLDNVKKKANSVKSHEAVKSMYVKLDEFEHDIENGLTFVAASARVLELSRRLIALEESVDKNRLSGILAKRGLSSRV